MNRVVRSFGSLVLIVFAAGSLNMLVAQQYSLKKEIQIGGEGIWDFVDVDPVARRLYVPHGPKVFVIDTDNTCLCSRGL
ncbi:MAG TPA: hypothetical protein VER98_11595 [Terriglobia bacterium]|nr:hypothetical protein [Terriglobia bacterium]